MENKTIKQILNDEIPEELLALFTFDNVSLDELVLKFNLWARYFYPRFFGYSDAPFHKDIDRNNIKVYLGVLKSFTDAGFRGCAKTTRTKLFIAFCIANDLLHRKKYIKVLSQDGGNSKQVVTDIYNLLIDPRVKALYPQIFAKTDTKREETMSSFTTATGIKLMADTVGSTQRGQIQDEARPDLILYDDFETRISLRSAVTTKMIWDNMEEAKNGLSKDGGSLYLCNYLSERGNVHKLFQRKDALNVIINIPIWDEKRNPTWESKYTKEDIISLQNTDDFEGEYLGEPAKGKDVLFDRDSLDRQVSIVPLKEIAGQKIFKKYDPSHSYGLGADTAGGVGLDSSTSVIIDFTAFPAQVVATYADNEIKPEVFGDELARQGERFGECLIAPENNKYDSVIGRLKQIYPLKKLYITQREDTKTINRQSPQSMEYGWNTNALTKPKMLFSFAKAVEDGLVQLNDENLINECKSYTRDDLMDRDIDPRLTTRHFDLLIAVCIAWQMKDYVKPTEKEDKWTPPIEETREFEGAFIPNATPQEMQLYAKDMAQPLPEVWQEPQTELREFEE